MPSWKKVITSGSNASLNSLYAPSITGSLLGTASFAISASYALTASYSNNLQISGSINNVDYIDFNTGSATPTWKSGRVFWDNTDGCLNVYNAEADITLQVGQENWTKVRNNTGTSITNGTIVKIIGAQGDVPTVERAQSVAKSGSINVDTQILGVATHTIEDSSIGYVTTQGLVRGLNTNAFNDGDTLFVGTGSSGVLQNTAPVAPYEIIPVGVCVKASPGGSGIIYVAVQQPLDFSDLSTVQKSGSYSYGDLWTYVPSGSFGVWKHTNQLSGSYGVTGSFSVQDSIDSSNKWLIGLGAMPGTTSTAVDWNSRVLYDTTGTTTSIDWQTRTLANSTGINNVDWENRYLYGPGPIPTSTEIAVDWNARQLSNSNGNIILDWGDSSPQFSGTASFATSASWAPGGGASFPYTGSAEITGSLGVTGSFSVLDSIDATNKILIGSGLVPGSTANSVNWDSRTLFDTNGNFSIRWGNLRTMYDANVSASIDWNNRQLKDANGIDIVNWQSGISITGSNITTGSVEVTGSFKVQDSIDSSNKWLIGPGGIPGSTATAVAWSDRQLLNSSGATIVNWETGVFTGTATSASFAATASFINPLNQSMVITGSLRGQVSALSILSNTASVDMVTNNFFTLTLPNGASTNINPTNINPGQTVNILVTQGSAGTGTVTFPSLVKQASGSLYTGSAVANAVDIVTMIAFDATNVYVSSIRNMI